jgi:lauroyl/myristoyl acyltransferase
MTEALHFDKTKPSPTLNTILMVEDTIKNSPNSAITIAELKRALPKQVNHNTLMIILEYLEKSNKIAVGLRGITWIKNDNKNLRNVAIHGLEL